jgi:polyisoprenoid-binding protein YceI
LAKILIAVLVLAVLGVGAVIGIQLLRSDDPNLATEAPEIPTSSSPAAAATGTVPTPTAGASSATAGVMRFVIDPAQSSAKYVVRETLRGLETNAVGETRDGANPDVSGEIYLTREGLHTAQPSTFRVDLRTIASDESMRDNFVRQNTLRTNQFPFAEFTVKSVTGFPSSYTENAQVQLTLSGDMTIRGVTKPVTFTVLARQAGDTLTATADADFKMTDFGITPPEVPFAKARDEIHIQVVLVAKQQSVG